ncbi:AF4/FMR2 family member lilli-like [Penaeus japonicus]|uniref:AF4/FMR2 family member lilli-like n=1 Tax=Penaeus japonicus TaxID=27405 RepID=UPI001C70DED6|nr:AF4/FMR2 family member lilli-like [Penaeus japonicus]
MQEERDQALEGLSCEGAVVFSPQQGRPLRGCYSRALGSPREYRGRPSTASASWQSIGRESRGRGARGSNISENKCVSGKPPSIPPHLLPPGSAAAAAVAAAAAAAAGVSSSSSASNNSSSTSISMTSGGGVVLSNKGVRTTATVPPLGLATPLAPLTTSAGAGPPSPTSSSSFAAALRSLAKQATAPPG